MISVTLLIALASMATGSPLGIRTTSPPTSFAPAFKIVANVTDPSKDFNPPINNWFVSGVHTGAGQNNAILTPQDGASFLINGTGRDVSAAATSIVQPPLSVTGASPVPIGLQFLQVEANNNVAIGLNIGLGTVGTGVTPGLRGAYANIFAPYHGSFMVCDSIYPTQKYGLRFAKAYVTDESGLEQTDIPENCVAVTLLAQCLSEPAEVNDPNYVVQNTKCYDDVASIDWSQY